MLFLFLSMLIASITLFRSCSLGNNSASSASVFVSRYANSKTLGGFLRLIAFSKLFTSPPKKPFIAPFDRSLLLVLGAAPRRRSIVEFISAAVSGLSAMRSVSDLPSIVSSTSISGSPSIRTVLLPRFC